MHLPCRKQRAQSWCVVSATLEMINLIGGTQPAKPNK